MKGPVSSLKVFLFSAFFACFLTPAFSQYDVALRLTTIATSPVKYGTSVPFNVTVFNQGSQPVTNVDVIVYLNQALTWDNTINTFWVADGVVSNAYTARISTQIDPGTSTLITINVKPSPFYTDVNAWNLAAEIYSFEDISGNIVNNLDVDSPHDKNKNNDAGGALGQPSDDAINGNGTGTPGSTSATTDEDDHDVAKVRIYDVALKKLLVTPGAVQYGDTLQFNSVVYNQGNETTGQVIIQELITEGYIWDLALNTPLGWTGAAPKPKFAFTGLLPRDSIIIPVKLILSDEAFDGEAWNNYTEVFSVRDAANVNVGPNEADSDVNSNSAYENMVFPGGPFDNQILGQGQPENEDEDDHDVAAPRIFDLAIKKERSTAVPSYSYTQNVTYTVTLYNQGNVTANTITITDTLPCGLEFLPALNPGWSISGPNKITYTHSTPLAPAANTTLQLIFGVNPCYVDPTNAWTNYIEISGATAADGGPGLDIDGTFDNILANDFQYNNLNNNNNIDALGPITNADEDNHDIELVQVVDFALKKLLTTPPPYSYGQNITFVTRIYNQGNVVSNLVRVKDIVPPGYHFNPALNPLWNAADTTYSITTRMFPEDTFDIPIVLSILPGDGRRDWFNYTSIVLVQDTVGNFRFDDADSFITPGNPAEFAVEPGDPEDNNIFVLGPPNVGLDEDDHDPAGFEVFDLALTKTLLNPQPSYDYGSTASFNIVVTNQGGTAASSVTVTDYLPCGLSFSTANNPNWTLVGGRPTYVSNARLAAGASLSLTLNLTVQSCSQPNAWRNVAEISAAVDSLNTGLNDFDSTPDTNPTNDPVGEDDIDDAELNVYDLALVKNTVNPQSSYSIGNNVTFRITVTNEGNLAASNVTVTDYMPCGFTFSTAGNPGWVTNGSGDPQYVISSLAPGQSVNLDITLTIVACSTVGAYTNAAEINNGNVPSGQPGNDSDSTPDFDETNDPDAEDDHDPETIVVNLTGALGGNVWNDADRDGLYDVGESFFANATVQLYDCFNNLIATDFTDNTGLFEFLNLQPGGYSVRVIQSTLPANTSFTLQNVGALDDIDSDVNAAGVTACITLDAGEVDYTNDAGYYDNPLGALGGNVWNDQDGDGLYDNGEPFTSGVTVELYDCNNRFISSDITDGGGLFEFLNLQPGGYVVRVVTSTLPLNSTYTLQNAGVNDNIDSDVNPLSGFTACITLDQGEIDYTNDAGYLVSTNIGDFVWNDVNGNGLQDPGESGVANVVVKLLTLNGTTIRTTTTNVNGLYLFNNVNPGNYYIMFVPGGDYSFIDANAGDDTKDSDVTGTFGFGTTASFTVVGGVSNLTLDAGLFVCAKIGEQVWYDSDKDDIWDPTENGINGLKVELYRRVNNNWVLYDYKFTGHKPGTPSDDGYFQFCAPPGTYYVRVLMPPLGLVQAKANVFGARPLTASNEQKNDSDLTNNFGKGTTESFTVTSGQLINNIGAGFYPMATVGNLVWEDQNYNGRQDSGEAPVSNILVQAFDVNNQLVGQAYTNADGVYKIDYLEKKDYYLKFNPPTGYGMTIANAIIDDAKDSDVDHTYGSNTTKLYAMIPGVDNTNVDAGVAFGVLPVKYNYIKASWVKDHNLIEWETALEINSDLFIIEKMDRVSNSFVAIGSVKARGNSSTAALYNFKDFDISQNGYHEYRILQLDLDGRYEYSDVVSVYVNKDKPTVSKVYPNPVREKFFIEFPETDGPVTYTILTIDGKVMAKNSLDATEARVEVNVSDLPRGSYQLMLTYNGKEELHKLIVLE